MKVPITAHKVKKTAKKDLHEVHADNLYKLAHPENAKRQKAFRRTLTHVVLPIALVISTATFAIGAEVVQQKNSTRTVPPVPANSICRQFSANTLSAKDARIGVTMDDPQYPFKFTFNFGTYKVNYLDAEDGDMNTYDLGDLHSNVLKSGITGFTYMKVCVSDPGPVMAPFNSRNALVDQQYRDFMGRSATATELSSWATKTKDMTAEQGARYIVNSFVTSEYEVSKRGPLVRLYKAYYKRWPDAGGYDYWVRKMNNGTSLVSVSEYFAQSPEFKRNYGSLSNEQFVSLVYTNVLGRVGDQAGYNYWVKKLNNKQITRGKLMAQFSESNEFRTKYGLNCELVGVSLRMYRRAATDGELAQWNPDEDASTLAYPIIFQSAEYANRPGLIK